MDSHNICFYGGLYNGFPQHTFLWRKRESSPRIITKYSSQSPTGLDKSEYQVNYFSCFSMKTYVVGTHLKCLAKALLMSTTKYVFMEKNINTFELKKSAMDSPPIQVVCILTIFTQTIITPYHHTILVLTLELVHFPKMYLLTCLQIQIQILFIVWFFYQMYD